MTRTGHATHQEQETLNAVTEYGAESHDGSSHHRINQYIIKQEIGRGSYGAVHLATDQFGTEYAVKEFSKVRLRKRAQSNILRQGARRPQRFAHRVSLNAPLSPHFDDGGQGGKAGWNANDALFFIREEIAIMKKLNHPNLVQLIEVLDDPEEDSLYMVLEMCKKGVVMKVGLNQKAKPYSEDLCRYWFRDLILGIEYLHEQGVIHRDIKPDNLLLTEDDVLKIVDFGVSEMFEKPGEGMKTAKSAGSPAFLAPELCVVRHGDVDGRAADIWSMGVSLYCLRYGKIPFEHEGVLEMYEAIKTESPDLPEEENPDFVDLMGKILEKDPQKRIQISGLRDHPWVTKKGTDPLLSKEDNCSVIVEPPNDLELSRAFTRKMNHLLCVMKAIHRFKSILSRQRQSSKSSRDGSSSLTVDPIREDAQKEDIEALIAKRREFLRQQGNSTANGKAESEPLILGIGVGARDEFDNDEPSAGDIAESPTNVDFNIYDKAYEAEVERIMKKPARQTTMYLTRFVKDREHYKEVANVVEGMSAGVTPVGTPKADIHLTASKGRFADLVSSMTGGSQPKASGEDRN
ncbi:Calcium calmodulin dependent protein kinase [Colletotrichum higginsianum IMI 349063]|uniref:Calcium calmodulin dependent protein kinase n=1 Tax=Colletotrichum higginsianum (strain IMI 349063) TaxID=759273 RepID=A0A1B7YP15_COLHI|nr:Calcium calmodulin dependent protein kinase [Colletotrichum higginsianum IMI 349063]OBR13618.1 Calcium calmodulin dependent protein kinase [Colletotrichum higginsianum IMI 349063]